MNAPALDLEKIRREEIRWLILLTLLHAQPVGTTEAIILNVLNSMQLNATQDDVRRQLDYLALRELVTIDGRGEAPVWSAKLTRHGADIAEYTVPCEPGIARPQKYY